MDVDVGIVAQRDNGRAQELAVSLLETLTDDDVTVAVDDATGNAVGGPAVPVNTMGRFDLVVSIGGDGTFLFVAREAGDAPILGVNLGEVGFLNAVPPEDALEAVSRSVDRLRSGDEPEGTSVDRLQVQGDGLDLPPALNEIVVHGPRRGHGGGTTVDVRIDGESYAESHVDGVLVSTPTGSTAYNLSEGGPLVRTTVDAIVVTQMSPVESMPPLVVDDDSAITLEITGVDTGWVICDGRNRRRLDPPTTVTVGLADDPVTLAGPRGNFFDALEKLE